MKEKPPGILLQKWGYDVSAAWSYRGSSRLRAKHTQRGALLEVLAPAWAAAWTLYIHGQRLCFLTSTSWHSVSVIWNRKNHLIYLSMTHLSTHLLLERRVEMLKKEPYESAINASSRCPICILIVERLLKYYINNQWVLHPHSQLDCQRVSHSIFRQNSLEEQHEFLG